MCKRLTYLVAVVALLGLIGAAYGYDPLDDPDLLGWWEFDEGVGTTCADSSPNERDGEVIDGDPIWVEGVHGSAIQLEGTLVEIPALDMTLTECTMAGWVKPQGAQAAWSSVFMMRGNATGLNINPDTGDLQLGYHWGDAGATWSYRPGVSLIDNEWNFVALTITPSAATFYLDGEEVAVNAINHGAVNWDANVYIGGDGSGGFNTRRFTNAQIDDASLFSRALTGDEIRRLMTGLRLPGFATNPTPADEATDVPRETSLAWRAGDFAASRDVYFGTVFDDVNEASVSDPRGVLVSEGQTDTTFDPPSRLEFGQTYYWRVDEVNAAPDFTVFKGNVWSFTTEPLAYPIPNVLATSSIPSDADQGPELLVDGSGLSQDGQRHSINQADMWVASPVEDEPAVLQFDFDRPYKLHKVQIWNFNHQFEFALEFSLKDITIEYAVEPNEWIVFGDEQLSQGPGQATYEGESIDLQGIAARSVRIIVASHYGGTKYGLSEVRFYAIPTYAREPQPEPGVTGIDPDVTLSWRAGREAASHLVYFGTDQNDVAGDVALLDTTTTNMYDLGTVNLDTTYYWKITEVNEAETPAAWPSEIWSFSTTSFVVVDDFEDYDNDDNRIYYAWLDGYGVATNGSQVGHDGAPYAEETIVRSGSQSMPFQYGQEGATTSEATLTLDVPQDWTAAGVTTLVVYFRGELGNAPAQLYAKINNTRVDFPGDPAALAAPLWKQWNIDLTLLGNAASNVTSLTIGVSGSGSGRLFVDDIRLHATAPDAPEAAVDPGTANLMAYYPMSGNAADASGNGYDGIVETGSSFGDGPTGYGQAVVLDGASGHVTLPIGSLIQSLDSITVAAWVRRDGTGSWQRVFDFGNDTDVYMFITTNAAGGGVRFAITTSSGGGESGMTSARSIPSNGTWHHVAGTIDGATGEMNLYVDGALVGSTVTETLPSDLGETTQNWIGRSQWPDPYLNGAVDDFRIYDRALSEGEVRYLVGDR